MIAQARDEGGVPTIESVAGGLKVLTGHGGAVEIRTIDRQGKPTNRVFQAGTDPRKIAAHALAMSAKGANVYWTLNPLRPGLRADQAASDDDVLTRFWLLIDIDPKRPGDTSATADEKRAAKKVIRAIRDLLRERGWPDPVLADSGNGFHLLYRVDLPNDGDTLDLIKAVLAALARRFDDDGATVDLKVRNASRICKVYGTVSRKGDSSEERPHRVSRIITIPDDMVSVTREQLEGLVTDLAPPKVDPPPPPAPAKPPGGGVVARAGSGLDPLSRASLYLAKVDPAVSGHRGHDTTFRTACDMVEFGLTEDQVFRLLWDEYNPRCEPPWTEKELRHKVEDAFRENGGNAGRKLAEARNGRYGENGKASRRKAAADNVGPADDPRPEIMVSPELHLMSRAAISALRGAGDTYQRAGALVRVVRLEQDVENDRKGHTRYAGSPRIVEQSDAGVRCVLSSVARFMAWDGRMEGYKQVPPPADIARIVAQAGEYPGVPDLAGITEAPTIRPDGSLLTTPGYDETTGLLYLPSADFPAIPETPAQQQVDDALALLMYPLKDFPIADGDAGRAAWLAALLTVLIRTAIDGPVPGFLFTANVAASGKTWLCDLIGVIATGRKMSRDGYTSDDTEMDKRLTAIAMAGDRAILLDNVTSGSAVGGPALDRAITSAPDSPYRGRILGRSNMSPDLPWSTVLFVTGNNLAVRDDALRRFVPCFLESEEERPEERSPESFIVYREHGVDLLTWARQRRPELVSAALTILRHHRVSGSPRVAQKAVGGFDSWDRVVRQAVAHALADPCGAREKLAAVDETSEERRALVRAWATLCDGEDKPEGMTAAEALMVLNRSSLGPPLYPEVRALLCGWTRDGRLPTSRVLGNRLSRYRKNRTPYGVLDYAMNEGDREWFVRDRPSESSR